MSEVWFYHLTATPLDVALTRLLPLALSRGWRIELRGRDPARMAALDRALWLGPEEGFLAHGLAGGDDDARQPVLLTVAGQAAGNAPQCVVTVDAAPLAMDEVPALARAITVFDANTPAELDHARNLWRAVRDAGLPAQYWAEDDGRWVKKQG
ncbi:MAG: DNA polymerase III subunit chi [Rubellimicrobium sp.]|nr:DNA polymerase III subunit chi [Rubellimicrobium sp.]